MPTDIASAPVKAAERNSPIRHKWKWLALGAALLAAGFWLLRVRLAGSNFDWRVFRATLFHLHWGWLVASTAAVMASYFFRALRWSVLMRPVRPRPNLWNIFAATVIGFTAITLLGRPGEFVRPYLISVREKVSLSSQTAAWLLERIYDMLTVLAIFGFALGSVRRSDARLGPALSWVFATGGWFAAIFSVLTLGLLLAFRHFSEAMRKRLLDALSALPQRHFERAERLVTAFAQGVESTKSNRASIMVVAYTVLEWTTIAITTWCVVNSFGTALHFGWLDVLIFLGFLAFGGVVQIPGIGGGVQVVAVVVLTELFRVPSEVAAGAAVALWFISFVVVVPFGLLLAVREGVRWGSLRAIEHQVSP